MKQTILGQSPYLYLRHFRKQVAFCIALGLGAVAIHWLLVGLRTPDNHTGLLLLNILLDWLVACFLIGYLSLAVLPRYRLYQLLCRPAQSADITVTRISPEPAYYMGLPCFQVSLTDRTVFLPRGGITLRQGQSYTAKLVANMIVEVQA